jgi:hypothetical protein
VFPVLDHFAENARAHVFAVDHRQDLHGSHFTLRN